MGNRAEEYDTYTVEDGMNKQLNLFGIGSQGTEHHEKYLLGTITSMICGLVMCATYWSYKKWKASRALKSAILNKTSDRAPLITKK